MDARRRSDSGANQPAVQVVGFHVEGQSPSPGPSSILQESMRKITSGSPTPVIIPPHFQQPSRTENPASRNLAQEFAGMPGQAGITIPARKSLERKTEAPTAAAAQAAPQTTSSTAAAATTAAGTGTSSSAATSSTPAAPGAGPAAAADSSEAGRSSQTGAASSSGRSKPDNRPEGIVPKPKPATRAERRAQQEASRAAKAAAAGKPAGDGGRPPSAGAASDGGASTSSRTSRTGGGGGGEGGSSSRGGAAPAGAKGVSSGGPGSDAGDARSRPPSATSVGGGGDGSSKAGARSSERRGRTSGGMLNFTELFAHLPQYRAVSVEGMLQQQQQQRDAANVHPAVFALGLQYADGSIKGSTARCVAMVHALAQMVADYTTPPGKSLARDLMSSLNAAVDYLVRCRPLSVSMGNAIKHIKLGISKIDPSEPEASAKAAIIDSMRDFIHEKVTVADQVLVRLAVAKVLDGDVILTYAYSQVVLQVLLEAHAAGRKFRVVVVDGRPELEGRQMLRRLLAAQVPCSYLYLSGLSYIMGEVTKVLLGAAAVLSNGTVVSRAGSAAVAMMAAANSTPVLVCCETLKFHERVQLDSITHNELGDPLALVTLPPHVRQGAGGGAAAGAGAAPRAAATAGWQTNPRLGVLNLKYDVMPSEYVTVVVTEFGMIPPSSVPVILREYSESTQQEQG